MNSEIVAAVQVGVCSWLWWKQMPSSRAHWQIQTPIASLPIRKNVCWNTENWNTFILKSLMDVGDSKSHPFNVMSIVYILFSIWHCQKGYLATLNEHQSKIVSFAQPLQVSNASVGFWRYEAPEHEDALPDHDGNVYGRGYPGRKTHHDLIWFEVQVFCAGMRMW